jgi:hypothetical protein
MRELDVFVVEQIEYVKRQVNATNPYPTDYGRTLLLPPPRRVYVASSIPKTVSMLSMPAAADRPCALSP